MIAASTKLSQSATVYKALETVNAASKAGSESLDEAQARILDSSLMSMKLSVREGDGMGALESS